MLEIVGVTLYDVKDLANLLGLHEKTIRALLRTGQLEGKKLAKKWYVTEESLKRFIQSDQRPPNPQES